MKSLSPKPTKMGKFNPFLLETLVNIKQTPDLCTAIVTRGCVLCRAFSSVG